MHINWAIPCPYSSRELAARGLRLSAA
jgi:hypothetical protein